MENAFLLNYTYDASGLVNQIQDPNGRDHNQYFRFNRTTGFTQLDWAAGQCCGKSHYELRLSGMLTSVDRFANGSSLSAIKTIQGV